MSIEIRQGTKTDLAAMDSFYARIHTAEENGLIATGWIRGMYPVVDTAIRAYEKGELFVLLLEGVLRGAASLNREQHETYGQGDWLYGDDPAKVMVMHTLAIDPEFAGQGLGKAFLRYYAEYALKNGCPCLRLDTNKINIPARKFYKKHGFREAGLVETEFNGIPGVELVLLENLAANLL